MNPSQSSLGDHEARRFQTMVNWHPLALNCEIMPPRKHWPILEASTKHATHCVLRYRRLLPTSSVVTRCLSGLSAQSSTARRFGLRGAAARQAHSGDCGYPPACEATGQGILLTPPTLNSHLLLRISC